MSIASEITKLNTNLTASYTACSNKGATLPASQNFDNLASTISAIPAATEPTLASLTVTPSTTAQTITPPSGTDGYNTVIASAVTASIDSDIVASNIKSGVNILGVDGSVTELKGQTKNVTLTSTSTTTITPSSGYNGLTSVKVSPKNQNLTITPTTTTQTFSVPSNYSGYGTVTCNAASGGGGGGSSRLFNANYVVLPDGTVQNIVLDGQTISATATTISRRIWGYVPANSIYVDLSSIQQTTSAYGLSSAFEEFSNLEYVDISNLEKCSLFDYAFAGTSLSKLYFNSMSYSYCEDNWYDEETLTGMLTDVTGCTVHFPSNFQSLIGSWSDVIDGFGGTDTTILFDLPATS